MIYFEGGDSTKLILASALKPRAATVKQKTKRVSSMTCRVFIGPLIEKSLTPFSPIIENPNNLITRVQLPVNLFLSQKMENNETL